LDSEGIDPVGARCALGGKPIAKLISHSPDKIKHGFGGTVLLYPEAYYLVYNPIYRWFYHRLKPQITKQSIMSIILDFL
jgi:hypothetical protein